METELTNAHTYSDDTRTAVVASSDSTACAAVDDLPRMQGIADAAREQGHGLET